MLLISWLNIIYHKSLTLCKIGKCISAFYLEGVKLRSKQLRTFYFKVRINYDSSYSNLKILKPRKIKLTNSGASGKESACQCRRCTRPKRRRFDPCDGKIPWSRKWQRPPVFLPGKFQGQKTWWAIVHGTVKELDITQQLNNNNLHTLKLTHIKFFKSVYRFVSPSPESKFVLYYFCNIIYKAVQSSPL